VFIGTQSEKIQMIGNAVPVRLSESIARTLKENLQYPKKTNVGGALLSFVPTLSTGMSPVLQTVYDEVNEFFLFGQAMEQRSLWA
jgi:DNA (cytosine-5)-methyltransferase 1